MPVWRQTMQCSAEEPAIPRLQRHPLVTAIFASFWGPLWNSRRTSEACAAWAVGVLPTCSFFDSNISSSMLFNCWIRELLYSATGVFFGERLQASTTPQSAVFSIERLKACITTLMSTRPDVWPAWRYPTFLWSMHHRTWSFTPRPSMSHWVSTFSAACLVIAETCASGSLHHRRNRLWELYVSTHGCVAGRAISLLPSVRWLTRKWFCWASRKPIVADSHVRDAEGE